MRILLGRRMVYFVRARLTKSALHLLLSPGTEGPLENRSEFFFQCGKYSLSVWFVFWVLCSAWPCWPLKWTLTFAKGWDGYRKWNYSKLLSMSQSSTSFVTRFILLGTILNAHSISKKIPYKIITPLEIRMFYSFPIHSFIWNQRLYRRISFFVPDFKHF